MREVRNSDGKLVCIVDPKNLVVEIVKKGQKTIIVFRPGREPLVTNTSR